jgi:hypothetical protein
VYRKQTGGSDIMDGEEELLEFDLADEVEITTSCVAIVVFYSCKSLPEVRFSLSSKSECTNWVVYLNQHVKTKGPLTEREYTTFLNFSGWNTSYFTVLPLPQSKITFI